MATFLDLTGSFRSLVATIQNRWSTQLPAEVEPAYRAQMAYAAELGRDDAAWAALPDNSRSFDAVVTRLDGAARALAAASRPDVAAMLAALEEVRTAMGALDALLRT